MVPMLLYRGYSKLILRDSLAKSLTRTVSTQISHLFASLLAYVKLERLNICTQVESFRHQSQGIFSRFKNDLETTGRFQNLSSCVTWVNYIVNRVFSDVNIHSRLFLEVASRALSSINSNGRQAEKVWDKTAFNISMKCTLKHRDSFDFIIDTFFPERYNMKMNPAMFLSYFSDIDPARA